MGKNRGSTERSKRNATVYDAVAGRIGRAGFLTQLEIASGKPNPSKPEEVLLRRLRTSADKLYENYDADEDLTADKALPDSDLLKAIHAYVSDFYSATTEDRGKSSFRTMDETALLAVGILLEEAAREILGPNGDMVLVEPEGLENGLPEIKMTQYQVTGTVQPPLTPEPQYSDSDSDIEDQRRPRKRRR